VELSLPIHVIDRFDEKSYMPGAISICGDSDTVGAVTLAEEGGAPAFDL
jgi:ADP-ribosylglycohydrolase